MDLLENRFEILENRSAIGQIVWRIKAQVVMLLFWSAILLPILYISLLITGIRSSGKLDLFLVLVGLHLVTLIGGHPYRRATDS